MWKPDPENQLRIDRSAERCAMACLIFAILFIGAAVAKNRDDIRDDKGLLIAWIDESPGRILLKDKLGRTLGYYIPKEDKTYRANGTFVGKGNQLMRLLK